MSSRFHLAGLAALAALLLLAPAPLSAQSACGAYHTIDSGDTLVEVAQQCGVTVPALLAANPGVRDQEDLEVGSRLRVPDPAARQPSPVEACGPAYPVRSGDTLAEIATKCGLTVPLLVAANPSLPDPLWVQGNLAVRIPDVTPTAVADPMTIAAPARTVVTPPESDEAIVADGDSAAIPAPELERVEGVLEAGPRCLRVRGTDGGIVAIAGQLRGDFSPGDRVVLLGLPTDEADCDAPRTLDLRILYRDGG